VPRRARLALAGIPWHIIQRGNNRAVCFHAEDDYEFYLHHLKTFSEQFGCAVHAYVLMTNHVHLLATPEREDSTALMMKHLGQRYVQYINRSHRRSGTLWEGRFRSCLTQTEKYVLACYRYIEQNPVRAAMVSKAQDYRWSSFHANAMGKANAILTPHEQYRRLGRTEAERRQAYRALFRPSRRVAARRNPQCDQRQLRTGRQAIPATDRSGTGPARNTRNCRAPAESTAGRRRSAAGAAVRNRVPVFPVLRFEPRKGYRSSGVRPVCLAIRFSMRGPISSLS